MVHEIQNGLILFEFCTRKVKLVTFIILEETIVDRNDHTTVTAPLPVCSAKLSTVGPG